MEYVLNVFCMGLGVVAMPNETGQEEANRPQCFVPE